jgi:DNA polymerase I
MLTTSKRVCLTYARKLSTNSIVTYGFKRYLCSAASTATAHCQCLADRLRLGVSLTRAVETYTLKPSLSLLKPHITTLQSTETHDTISTPFTSILKPLLKPQFTRSSQTALVPAPGRRGPATAAPCQWSPLSRVSVLSLPLSASRLIHSTSQTYNASSTTSETTQTSAETVSSDTVPRIKRRPDHEYLKGVTIVDSVETAQRVVKLLQSDPIRHSFHAIDTEVINVDLKEQSPCGHGEIICFSIFCGPQYDFGSGPKIWVDTLDTSPQVLETFRDYLKDETIKKVWHNYSFDRHEFYNHSLDVRGLGGDTLHMARLWNAARTHDGGYSLESLSEELLGHRKVPIKERFSTPRLLKNGLPGKVVEFPALDKVQRDPITRAEWIDYSTYDTEATWNLREVLHKKLVDIPWAGGKTMYDFYQMYWVPFGELLTEMERAGVYVRAGEYLRDIEQRALKDRDAAAKQFHDWACAQDHDAVYMNFSSDVQKQQFFFGPCTDEKGQVILPASREFNIENTEGYIEPGRTQPKKMRPFLLKGLGIPVPDAKFVTKGGKPAVSLTVMRALAGDNLDSDNPRYGTAYSFFGGGDRGREACEAIDALCRVSAIDTLLSNFITTLIANVDENSRIHCSLNLNTETGRLSARRPNLQNQPALEKDIYKIRDAFACNPADNTMFIVADYGQLELRLLAHMANCQSMIDAFKAGGDFHSRTAVAMYPHIREAIDKGEALLEWDDSSGKPPPAPLVKDLFGSERRKAKTLNFSIAYGKTALGLSRDWNTSLEEAEDTLKRWYDDRPEVRDWQQATIQRARDCLYTRTLMGRYRPLPDIISKQRTARGHAERAAINTPIQGGAADVVMKAMILLHQHERFREIGWKMLLQVHDEIMVEGPRESVDEAMSILRQCMEHPFENALRVELVVDATAATTWYEAK